MTTRQLDNRARDRVGLLGCGVFAIVLLALVAHLAVTWWFARVVTATFLFAVIALLATGRWKLVRSVRAFRQAHRAARKDLLLVYSASPHWQSHIETEWLPRWADRAVVLNRSAPDWTTRPEAALWSRMTAIGDHTPAAIVIPAHGRARVFRFFKAFRDYKHGNAARLKELEGALAAALERSAGSR